MDIQRRTGHKSLTGLQPYLHEGTDKGLAISMAKHAQWAGMTLGVERAQQLVYHGVRNLSALSGPPAIDSPSPSPELLLLGNGEDTTAAQPMVTGGDGGAEEKGMVLPGTVLHPLSDTMMEVKIVDETWKASLPKGMGPNSNGLPDMTSNSAPPSVVPTVSMDASNQMGHAPQTPPKQLVPAFHRPVASVSPMSFDCPMSSSDLVTADVPVISVIQDPLARVAYAIMRAVGRDGLN